MKEYLSCTGLFGVLVSAPASVHTRTNGGGVRGDVRRILAACFKALVYCVRLRICSSTNLESSDRLLPDQHE